MKIYALYKGDKFIYEGTKIQIAYQRGVKVRTIEFLLTPTYKNRRKNSNNSLKLIEIKGE